MKKGYAAITGDILHSGHMNFLEICKNHCDWLVVGIMTDNCVRKYKGCRPAMPYEERMAVIRSIKWVDEIMPQYDFEFGKVLEIAQPDIVFDNEMHNRFVSNKYMKMLVAYSRGISSTKIKERIIDIDNRECKA